MLMQIGELVAAFALTVAVTTVFVMEINGPNYVRACTILITWAFLLPGIVYHATCYRAEDAEVAEVAEVADPTGEYIRFGTMVDSCPDMCPICHEEEGTRLRLRCGHMFHEHCLMEWVIRRPVCPMCSDEIILSGTPPTAVAVV
jgi:hypothetical protein